MSNVDPKRICKKEWIRKLSSHVMQKKLLQETERRLIRDWKINHLMITRRRYRRKMTAVARSSEIIAPLQKRRTREKFFDKNDENFGGEMK